MQADGVFSSGQPALCLLMKKKKTGGQWGAELGGQFRWDSPHVLGRLRIQRYTGADGVERQAVEIVANRIHIHE